MFNDDNVMTAMADPRVRDAMEVNWSEADLRTYMESAWHIVEPATRFRPNWHIDAIADHLQAVSEGHIRRLIINIPPRHMKSLQTAVLWPTWDWGPANHPHRRWLFASYAMSLSIRDSLKCRRLIQSPWYQARWGSRFKLTNDQNAKIRFDTDKTGYRLATSVDGALTGEGGDIIVVDDPHNATEGESETIRQSTLDWWDAAMSTRLNDPKTGAYVIVMQRLHEADLCGHILSREHDWEHLCLPARYESEHPTPIRSSMSYLDERKVDGALLWPDRVGETELSELETRLGPYRAAGQLQQRPAPAEGGLFQRAYFRYFENKGDYYLCQETGRRVHRRNCWRFMTIDTAMTTNKMSDYNVRMVFDVERVPQLKGPETAGEMFLIDMFRQQTTAPLFEEQLIIDHGRFRPMFMAIEGVSDGLAMYQRLRQSNLPVRRMRYYDEVWSIPDKRTKAIMAETHMAMHKVRFDVDCPQLGELERELLTFPNALHDDMVDGLSMGCHLAYNRNLLAEMATPPQDAPGSAGQIAGHAQAFRPAPTLKDPFDKRRRSP